MYYTIQQIAQITDGNFLRRAGGKAIVKHLLTDSRQLIFPETTLFFALPGISQDGHAFLEKLYEAGVRSFIVEKKEGYEALSEANIIKVADVLAALQQLAAHHRQQFDIPVIGITGSNGKTIVKEWLFQLLRDDHRITRSPRSYNSQVGVPLSVWQLQPRHTIGIFEAGISQTGEMARTAQIIRCTAGIFTNIGEAHAEGFSDLIEKLQEKLLLFEFAEVIVYCKDNPSVDAAIRALNKPVFSWSRTDDANLRVIDIRQNAAGQAHIEALFQGEKIAVTIPFSDAASIENAIHCWAMLLFLEVPQEIIEQRMATLEPVAMRLELREGINGCTLINDSYNSDFTSLSIALNFMEQQRGGARRTLILSDILQSGREEADLYADVALLIREKGVNRLVGIGQAVHALKNLLPPSVSLHFYETTAEFLRVCHQFDFQNEVILLKGARPYAFEKIARRLSQKMHRTVLEVNLSALAYNLRLYREKLRPETKVMAMVKAAAYGSGSLETARLLEFHKVDYLAVAYADEGAELRRGGILLPILVLNPEEAAFDNLLRYNLEPEIYSLTQLRQFAQFSADAGRAVAIHLKLDTGMRRLGFEAEDLEALLELLAAYPHLSVRSLFSHLAASEAPDHDDFTRSQIEQFEAQYELISEGIGYRPLRHILNSGGIERFPQAQMDMVRLGIGLYGIGATGAFSKRLKPVLSLKATISQIKQAVTGTTIGYGRRGRADQDKRIATISIGYADGLLRAAGNGHFSVLAGGKRAPIIGSVCMDMCMIDVTQIPDAKEGDEIEIFGDNLPVAELAAALQTIPYEVFTCISPRVKRVYVQE
ncbi:MAG: bifunctional UDP-N-acetylmuramoyl-tripeptide:D-alanyl-D-alanine ligase/alanine racemase [Saprospiraceae bacterium]